MTKEAASEAGATVGYATGRARKQEIVEHAVRAFANKGFYGTSLRAIARAVDVDHTVLIHHFGNKTELLLAVVAWYDEQHQENEIPDVNFENLLVEAVVATAEKNERSPGLIRLLSVLSAEAGEADHPARPYLQARHQRLVGIFAGAIEKRDEFLGRTETVSARDRAVLLVSLWEGLQVFASLSEDEIDVPRLLGDGLRRVI